MPKCKCGQTMSQGLFPFDFWGNELFECEKCGMVMKKVPYGNPEKNTYILFVLLSLFLTKKLWIKPTKDETNALNI